LNPAVRSAIVAVSVRGFGERFVLTCLVKVLPGRGSEEEEAWVNALS